MDEDLHRLIRSLTKNEKRYFKLVAGTHRKEAAYVKLFDLIDRQSVYDPDAVRTFLREQGRSQQAHVARHYLRKLILRSLRLYHSGRTANGEVKELLEDAQILSLRGLHDPAAASIDRAESVARRESLHHQLLEVQMLRRRLVSSRAGVITSSEALAALSDIHAEEMASIENLRAVAISRHAFDLLSLAPEVRSAESAAQLRALMPEGAIEGPVPTGVSYLPHAHLLYTRCNYFFAVREYVLHEHACREFLDLVGSSGREGMALLQHLIPGIDQLLRNYVMQGRFEEAGEVLAEYRALAGRPELDHRPGTRAELLLTAYIYELDIAVGLGRFHDGFARIRDINADLKRYASFTGDARNVTLYYLIGVVSFGAGEYRSAIRWAARALDNLRTGNRPELGSFARLVRILSHFELGEITRAENLLRSYQRFLAQRHDPFRAELIMQEALRKILRARNERALREELRRLHAELIACGEDRFESYALQMFDLIAWVERRMGKSVKK